MSAETAGRRPFRQRGGVEGGWLLRQASGSPVRLQVAANQAISKHMGESRNGG